MAAQQDPRLELAVRHLGPVTIQRYPSLPPHLLLLTDTSGTGYVVKQHRDPDRFAQEAHAYTAWIPQLGDRAPQLIVIDPAASLLLLTLLPGRSAAILPPGSAAEQHAHRAAGLTLRLCSIRSRRRTTAQPAPSTWDGGCARGPTAPTPQT
ncbi:hypothetical protein [Planotetraspora mira]|uniref:Uncharacterized protein n=1 Tax=Planotetraspora mira TaxID=58121 RepID=A0A8J3TX11_9ACTN|nr:hypothetical protein [Planotetraspora mira]GII34628.1 hypothetical protein Pmi06nite_80700 [Planotetraspora mira]